ncbi:MAG: hypothetical protein MK110_10810 [Fuerstiella sp.]|nr:hypothetical protein [Fuerstiella sp.]MCH2211785.1 hypothetical protein [Fuerstiella sp.]
MKTNNKRLIVLIAACFVTVFLRIQDTPVPLDSMIALTLLCGVLVRHPAIIILPLAIRLLTDSLLWYNTGYGFYPSMLFDYSAYLLIALIAKYLPMSQYLKVVAGGLVGPCLFFVVSNLGVWALWPDTYASTLAGLMNCYAQGLPFLRGSVMGNFVFALIFLGAWHVAVAVETKEALAAVKTDSRNEL